jgi:DNA polymerase III epsilon subunit-like protein
MSMPELVLGFDTETTGLSTQTERAITYGFCAYRDGRPEWSDQFFVVPDVPISPGAQQVHGISLEELRRRYSEGAALSVAMGLIRAVEVLRRYHQQGAVIVGANVQGFDLAMLRASYESVLGKDIVDDFAGFNELRVIDVIRHDVAMESRQANPRRRSLTHLCAHYGLQAGGHDALGDARAAVEVLQAQVAGNANDWSQLRPAVGSMDPDEVDRLLS